MMNYQENARANSALMGAGITNLANAYNEGQLAKNNRELAKYVYGDSSYNQGSASSSIDLSSLNKLVANDRKQLDQKYMGSVGKV